MKLAQIAETLWGDKSRLSYLLIASILLLLTMLHAREIWTQEHRWADIVSGMFYRQDFLHPYLGETRYYDKPLLSYWLIVFFAKLTGTLNTWTLRLPSALAGILAIFSIYRLGTSLKDRSLGLLSGWLLLTTFYFIFWARTSSADMLNMAGALFAIAWYFEKREQAGFYDYSVFFIIIALTCLCKGLVGAIISFIAVGTDILLRGNFKKYLRWSLFLSLFPALFIYILPFVASSLMGGENYGQNGLYLVYKENILRYFQPFDHQGPLYTYFIYLPIYLFPWVFFFIPALFTLKQRFKTMTLNSKWIILTTFLLFAFFTISGSRRSYYILPLVPFAILMTADWILSDEIKAANRKRKAALQVVISFILFFLFFNVFSAWYYSQFGINRFAATLKEEASNTRPWQSWQVVMLDAESKLNFYLTLPPHTKNYHFKEKGQGRAQQTAASLLMNWPILLNKPKETIFISRKLYVPLLQPYFEGYRLVELTYPESFSFIKKSDVNIPVAFIPA